MSIEAVRLGSQQLHLTDFQEKARVLKKTNVNILSVDRLLNKRITEFKTLDSRSTHYKVAAFVLTLFLFIGWLPAYTLWQKSRAVEGKKQLLFKQLEEQIGKDTNRQFVITLNGEYFTDPKSLVKALDRKGLSDVQKYQILQLSHQGVYATLLNAIQFDLVNWAYRKAPIVQEEGASLKLKLKESDPGDLREYYPKDITGEKGKTIDIQISKWFKTTTISTKMRLGLSVLDETAKPPYQQRVLFEFDTNFTINVKKGKMNISPLLDTINPLTGPVKLYGDESYEEVEGASATVSATPVNTTLPTAPPQEPQPTQRVFAN